MEIASQIESEMIDASLTISSIAENVSEKIESHQSDVTFNLSNVFGCLLYSVKIELEKEGITGGLDHLIRTIVNTTREDGPEGEAYPAWNNKDPETIKIIAALKKIFEGHGIKGT